jgi:hypothetical protein
MSAMPIGHLPSSGEGSLPMGGSAQASPFHVVDRDVRGTIA